MSVLLPSSEERLNKKTLAKVAEVGMGVKLLIIQIREEFRMVECQGFGKGKSQTVI
jgi:hypothetical protein